MSDFGERLSRLLTDLKGSVRDTWTPSEIIDAVAEAAYRAQSAPDSIVGMSMPDKQLEKLADQVEWWLSGNGADGPTRFAQTREYIDILLAKITALKKSNPPAAVEPGPCTSRIDLPVVGMMDSTDTLYCTLKQGHAGRHTDGECTWDDAKPPRSMSVRSVRPTDYYIIDLWLSWGGMDCGGGYSYIRESQMIDMMRDLLWKVPPCQCPDYEPGIAQLGNLITMASIRPAMPKYTGKPFKFCPWCGNSVKVTDGRTA